MILSHAPLHIVGLKSHEVTLCYLIRKCKLFPCVLLTRSDDHWLGLKKVFSLTKNKAKKWTMRVDLWDHEDGTAFAEYRDFHLANETSAFKLHVGEYNGNAGNAGFQLIALNYS